MSFLAKLELEGETYNVLECRYSFHQNVDPSGKPQGASKGGSLELTIESNGKTNFIDWMLSSDKYKDGKITFFRRDAMSRMQEIVIEKGFCINFTESFDANNTTPLQISLVIIAGKLSFGNVSYNAPWRT